MNTGTLHTNFVQKQMNSKTPDPRLFPTAESKDKPKKSIQPNFTPLQQETNGEHDETLPINFQPTDILQPAVESNNSNWNYFDLATKVSALGLMLFILLK